jgi:hypothetical protein
MLFRLVEMEMFKLYNRAFNVGVLFNVLLFSALNLLSYFSAYKRYLEYRNVETKLAQVRGFPSWGFPFGWGDTHFNIIWFGDEVLNFVVLAFCGFVFGFLFRFVWSKISSRRAELK